MPIDWQTRGAGPLEHRYHRLTEAQVAALPTPAAQGVYELAVDGEAVYTWALHTPALQDRPLRWLPVVYATRDDAEAHGEAWATRDRAVFWAEADRSAS